MKRMLLIFTLDSLLAMNFHDFPWGSGIAHWDQKVLSQSEFNLRISAVSHSTTILLRYPSLSAMSSTLQKCVTPTTMPDGLEENTISTSTKLTSLILRKKKLASSHIQTRHWCRSEVRNRRLCGASLPIAPTDRSAGGRKQSYRNTGSRWPSHQPCRTTHRCGSPRDGALEWDEGLDFL